MTNKHLFILVVAILLLMMTACQPKPAMPNPASVFCEENGGTLELREDPAGGQMGVCVFEDRSECEEWAFYRGECQPGDFSEGQAGLANPASVFCEENQGTLEIREDESGGQMGICVFEDESECEEWAFYRGECQPGED